MQPRQHALRREVVPPGAKPVPDLVHLRGAEIAQRIDNRLVALARRRRQERGIGKLVGGVPLLADAARHHQPDCLAEPAEIVLGDPLGQRHLEKSNDRLLAQESKDRLRLELRLVRRQTPDHARNPTDAEADEHRRARRAGMSGGRA